jgi:putative heme iron utilization protein
MNTDHAQNLRDYCHLVHEREVLDVEMIGIDCDGFDVRADGELLRFDFDAPATTPEALRSALVELARRARA